MTITHSSFQVEIDEILSEIAKISRNRYIEKYVTIPEISIIRLQLLNISLYHASVPKPLRILYCITTGLIQMGLDLHENITTYNELTEKGIRNRQLSILAGDYYSSQYYYLLSENNLTDGIKKIAVGIRNINIAKMDLYSADKDQDFNSMEHLLNLIKVRDSNLYTQFIDMFDSVKQRELWQFLLEDMILLFSLLDELQSENIRKNQYTYFLINHYSNFEERNELNDTKNSGDLNLYKAKYLYNKYDIERRIEDTIIDIYNNLNMKIKGIENRLIQTELSYLLNRFTNLFHVLKVVEKI